jgi:hypothetical protein
LSTVSKTSKATVIVTGVFAVNFAIITAALEELGIAPCSLKSA